jgi:hypothetical protein
VQHWPQPPRRVGFGSGLPDFNALVAVDASTGQPADPVFASGWTAIQAQLTAEGTTDFTGAKIALADSYTSLIGSDFGLQAQDAIDAAKKYVTIGQTIVGAVGTVTSLIQAGNSGSNPTQVFQAFTGTMIALAVSTGAASAGVGAAIVGVVAISIDLFNQVVGGPAKVYNSTNTLLSPCDPINKGPYGPFNIDQNSPPSFGVGSIAAWGPSYSPDSPLWRSFPDPSADPVWFVQGQIGPGNWKGAFFGAVNPQTDQGNTQDKWWRPAGTNPAGVDQTARPIDNAFPAYTCVVESSVGLQLDTTGWPTDWVSTYRAFVAAYQAAWRANAAYALNGLKPQDDAQVLVHLIRMWNRSHDGPPYTLLQSSSYVGQLVTSAFGAGSQSDIAGNGGLLVNFGPAKAPPPMPLNSGQTLTPGQHLVSPSGQYSLVMQSDGNLALYDSSNNFLWGSNQNLGVPLTVASVAMQTDGNLVLYDANGGFLWGSVQQGAPSTGQQLSVNNAGSIVLTDASGAVIWSAGGVAAGAKAPMTTGEKVAVGTAVVGGGLAIGTLIYAWAVGETVGMVVKGAWRGIRRAF